MDKPTLGKHQPLQTIPRPFSALSAFLEALLLTLTVLLDLWSSVAFQGWTVPLQQEKRTFLENSECMKGQNASLFCTIQTVSKIAPHTLQPLNLPEALCIRDPVRIQTAVLWWQVSAMEMAWSLTRYCHELISLKGRVAPFSQGPRKNQMVRYMRRWLACKRSSMSVHWKELSSPWGRIAPISEGGMLSHLFNHFAFPLPRFQEDASEADICLVVFCT